MDVGGWAIDPASGRFVWASPGSPVADPFQYKYELQCHLGGGDFDADCLETVIECKNGPDGKDGIPVTWLKAPAGVPNPVWSYHSGPTCLFDARPEDLLPRIAAMIQSEFQKLPISAGRVTAQPSPHTLRGADTNFYAEAAEQQFDIKILAQDVHIEARPVQYTWNYGDGTTLGPQNSAGGPLPQDRWGEKTATSHVYTRTGDFSVVLTTSFLGTYSVNGGPPLPIPGQGQFNAPPRPVSVWRSITRNYADDCLKNPQGAGCPGAPPGSR
ncbi:hypothetical protein ASG71_10325 [Arthrobacter sp. Soil763]|nr:hypothetical protein ASG71_10325 [Arthrobacter sp. Soil763]